MSLMDAIGAAALIAKLDRMNVTGEQRRATLRHALSAAERDGRDADRQTLMVALTDPRNFLSPN